MIESTSNKFTKEINKLKTRKERDKTGKFVLEGYNFVKDMPKEWDIDYFVLSESFSKKEEHKNLLFDAPVYVVLDKIFEGISDTVNPQGILTVCNKKTRCVDDYINQENAFFLICENICDPGNIGVMIRTATAAGCTGVILSKGCVDVYNPKTIRSTAGAIFSIPIFEEQDMEEILTKLKSHNIKIIATHLRGEVLPYDVDLKCSCGIMIGNEANGLTDKASEMADVMVKIPMIGSIESLNASVASSVLLYETVRQRVTVKQTSKS